MMPKARIYKEDGDWLLTVSFFPSTKKLDHFTLSSFAEAVHGMEVYRMTLLNALAQRAAASQAGIVH